MSHEFTLPDLGEGVQEAEIQEIPVSVGDTVERDEVILVVETDKASVEIPSPVAGEIQDILVEAGDFVNVGDVLITFANGKEQTADSDTQTDESKDDQEQETEAQAKETTQEEKSDTDAEQDKREESTPDTGDSSQRPVPAAPATRRIAREQEVDLKQIEGSGPGGRVTRDDVENYAESGQQASKKQKPEKESATDEKQKETPSRQPTKGKASDKLPDFTKWGDTERIELRSVRRVTAQRMTQSWSNIPHVNHHDKADVTELEQLRQKYQDELGLQDLNMMVFVMKAVVSALKNYPRFNASLDVDANEIILKHYYHVGIAVDTERGLLVPVIQDVDRKSIVQLAEEVTEAAERARSGETSVDEMRGGSFTITNIGPLGGTHFDPIINFPQSAILGMARIDWEPIVRSNENGDHQIEPRYMLPLVMAYDHRLSDGADAARFTNEIIAMLEDPDRFILEMS